MRTFTIIGACVLAALTAATAGGKAAPAWKSVTIGRGASLEIPARVGKRYQPETGNPDGLLHFSTTTAKDGRIDCDLDYRIYSSAMSQSGIGDRITSSPEILCPQVEGATGSRSLESHALTSNGFKAATCVTAETFAQRTPSGWVVSATVIAAPHGYYTFTCGFGAATQNAAEAKWKSDWSATAAHMRDSLHIPGGEK